MARRFRPDWIAELIEYFLRYEYRFVNPAQIDAGDAEGILRAAAVRRCL
ncbi:MAG: hypothetical protein HYR72_13120 [Deltaproteobacteria bacterium]|nr:hypothetical protein [Deltaproteobacteria bacterium]MBI3386852.1 hypothetical protein [Deltaproteobacteria bacterium]